MVPRPGAGAYGRSRPASGARRHAAGHAKRGRSAGRVRPRRSSTAAHSGRTEAGQRPVATQRDRHAERMSVAFLFPGQGSQRPGMLHDLPDHPAARDMILRATRVLDRDVLDLDTPEALGSTVVAQLALLIVGATTARILVEEGCEPDFVAGHSVGAFAAAVVAGALAYPDALCLVGLRARAMQEAYPHGYGMGVVVGLDERTVSRLADESGTRKAPVHAANVNAPLQISVAGTDDALERFLNLARENGARRAARLSVPVPSHTPLMASAAAELERALADVPMDPPAVPY